MKTNSRATAIKKEKTASASASASAEPEETKKTQAAKPKGKRKAIDNEEENDVEIKEEGFSFGKTASIFGTPFKRTRKRRMSTILSLRHCLVIDWRIYF